MKNIFIILLFLQYTGYSQNISLDEILFMKSENLDSVRNLLTQKGWFVFSELQPTKNEAGLFVFAVKNEWKDKNMDFSTNESFVEYHFTLKSHVDKINYKTGSKKNYKNLVKRLRELNYKPILKKSSETIYSDGKNTITIEVINNARVKNFYVITLINKSTV